MRILLLLIIQVFMVSAFAQNDSYFKHITNDDGLPANYVEIIAQSHEGFMWFGTSDGLSRYDGMSFLNFRNNSRDTTSLLNNEIKCLIEDKNERLWIGTQEGLTYLDLKTYKFHRLSGKLKENLGKEWISSIVDLGNNKLLIGTYGNGLYLFDYERQTCENFRDGVNKGLISNNIRCICVDTKKRIWIGTDKGLDKFDLITGQFVHVFEGEVIFQICLNPVGTILVTTLSSANIYTIDPESLKITNTEELDIKSKERAKIILFDRTGTRFVGISSLGIQEKLSGSNRQNIISKGYYTDGLNSNSILTLFEDKDGNIWIGTFDAGVNVLLKQRKKFLQVKSNNRNDGLVNNQIRSIFQDRDGDVWIGTKSGGMLSQFHRNNLTFTHYRNIPGDPNSLNDDIVTAITDGPPGFIWVGTLTGGINILNKHTGKFSLLKKEQTSGRDNESKFITSLYNDGHGKVWIGYGFDGFDTYDLTTKKIEHFSHSASVNSVSDNRVRVFYPDPSGGMWIGTLQGLNFFTYKTKTFRRFLNNENDITSISGNNITSITQDTDGNLWIGTTNGFNLFNRVSHSFVEYNKSNGFPGNSVRGILNDADGNLWISTDNGLVKYSVKNNTYKHYKKEDGLNSNEFTQYAFCRMRNEEMLFGTSDGFVLFNPKEIKEDLKAPEVIITGLQIFNKPVSMDSYKTPLKCDITYTRELTFTYKQSVVTLEFVAINYTSPGKNQFAYKLEGFDREWNYIGGKHDATYTNLPAGKYVFKVKASNNDGVWNDKGASLVITVLPPPWKTWWAYSIYILLIGIILIKLRDLTIKRIHEEKAHELDQLKLKLFMNISHEFRTPLTLMLSPIDKINTSNDIEEIRRSIKVVERSSWKLLNLVNQLLDFRKIDQAKSPLLARKTDIIGYSRKIVELFEELANSKKMNLTFKSTLSELQTWIDPDKYEKILTNLLSNAFKFTESGGSVTVSISKTDVNSSNVFIKRINGSKTKEFAEIGVYDTGIGLKEEDITHIFEQFYQVDQSKAGTGIGLNYVKALVELHGGELLVKSEYGKGSAFIVRIPLGNEHLKPEQIIVFDTNPIDATDAFNVASVESLRYDIENMDISPDQEEEDDFRRTEGEQTRQVVLIVEDNKTLRKQIRDYLNEYYIVKEATNGQEGWDKVQKLLPDLVISDIMMPKMDGIALCRHVKSELNTCHIPLILLTAKGTIENKIEGFETGADEYIPKPFSMKLLDVRVKNLIHSRIVLKEKFMSSKLLAPAKEYTTNNLDEAFLEKVTNIVLEHIEDPDFSLAELREKMGMGQTNLYTKLQSITGQNPSNFVRTVRLKYAAGLLLQNNLSIKDVCYKCGFNSPAYFTKTFKELYGQSPSEYIEKNNNAKMEG